MFRIEVWIHRDIESDEAKEKKSLEMLKYYLKSNFGSEVEDKPINV